MSADAGEKGGTMPRCGHHGNPLVYINDELKWRCPDCFPGESGEGTTTVTREQLGQIQAGLLAVSNYAGNVHGGLVEVTDVQAWRAQVEPFRTADAVLRALMQAAERDGVES